MWNHRGCYAPLLPIDTKINLESAAAGITSQVAQKIASLTASPTSRISSNTFHLSTSPTTQKVYDSNANRTNQLETLFRSADHKQFHICHPSRLVESILKREKETTRSVASANCH